MPTSAGNNKPADLDTFTFTATSNDVLFLMVLKTTVLVIFYYDPATTDIYTLSLHDALPILADTFDRRLTKTGTYTVVVDDNGLDQSFDYLISCNIARGEIGRAHV